MTLAKLKAPLQGSFQTSPAPGSFSSLLVLAHHPAPRPEMAKSRSARSKKAAHDATPVAPKDINGDVSTANELTVEDSNTPRSTRKRAGDFNDFEDDKVIVGHAGKDEPAAASAQPKKKPKTASAAEKKTKPSKADGHPIVTEKTHPGGDTVEAEPVGGPKESKKSDRKTGSKKEAAKKGSTARDSKSKAPGSKLKGDDKKSKGDLNDEVDPRVQADNNVSAPEKSQEKQASKPKRESKKSKKATDAALQKDTASAKTKPSRPGKATKDKDGQEGRDLQPASADAATVEPEQAMDEAPFKKLVKRERAKIPAVKASAEKAEAERKAIAASNTTGEAKKDKNASKAKDAQKDDKASKSKGSKSAPKGSSNDAATAPSAELSNTGSKAGKGKKRKDGPEPADTKADAGRSGKKQKKAASSALDAAKSAVGDLIDSGMEIATQGISAVKEFAAGLENKSIADDVTAIAEGVVEERDEKKKAEKGADKADKKGKGKAVAKEAETPADDFGGFGDEGEDDDDFEEGDQTVALIKGFESGGDEEEPNESAGFKKGMEVPQIPKNKDLTKKLKGVKDTSDGPGVVYVGRIPHGFYESQMRAYFSQFGPILRLRLSRNRTTGASKHYAFIEFESAAVAKIVAETMDTYLMFGHILKCKIVPPEQVHENLWKGANKRFKKVPWSKIEGRKLERKVGREVWEKRVETEKKRRKGKEGKLKEIGYEFEAGLKSVDAVPVKEAKKAIEGPAEPDESETVEKTLITTDGGDGSVVISEEVKTKRVKKGGKRKAEEEKVEEGPLAEVVKKAKKAKKDVAV
ncbi:MAG: hypothetical protein Q9181_006271 [Wetmoreana brouardii]